MKIAITGATGFIGKALVISFKEQGHNVVAIARKSHDIAKDVTYKYGNLGEPLSLEGLDDLKLVVHAAHDMQEGQSLKNIEGTKLWFNQFRSLTSAPMQIFLSSCSAYVDSPSEYGQTKYLLENFMIKNAVIVLRPGLVIGPGGLFHRMLNVYRALPIVPVLGGRSLQIRVTGLSELQKIIAQFENLSSRKILNVFSPQQISMYDLAACIRLHFNVRGVLFPVSPTLARFVLGVMSKYSSALGGLSKSFGALEKSQAYPFNSSYQELEVRTLSFKELLCQEL